MTILKLGTYGSRNQQMFNHSLAQQIRTTTSSVQLQTPTIIHTLIEWAIRVPRHKTSPILQMGYPKRITIAKLKQQSTAILLSPTTMPNKIKIHNAITCLGIDYAVYVAPFLMPGLHKLDKLLIRFTKTICIIPKCSPNIINQLPRDTFGIKTFSFLPRYVATLSKQLTQTLNDPYTLGNFYHGLVKYIVNKYGGIEHLSHLKYQACSKSPTTTSLHILKNTSIST